MQLRKACAVAKFFIHTAGIDHYFRTWCLSVRPFVHPSFQNIKKEIQVRMVIAIGGTVSLPEWIIDGTHVL